MAKLQKYLFDLDFDAPEGPPHLGDEFAAPPEEAMIEIEEAPPPPTFSEEELLLARDQAYLAGRQEALREAEAATERLAASALAALSERLTELVAGQQAAHEAGLRDAIAVALAVARKLLSEFARRHGLDEIEGVMAECLSHLDRDLRITVRVNPLQVDAVKAHAAQVAAGAAFEGKLHCTADPRVAPGDCRIEWGDGGAERDQARIWAEIEAVVERALTPPAAEAGEAERDDTAVSG